MRWLSRNTKLLDSFPPSKTGSEYLVCVMMMNCFCGMVDQQKAFKPYFQPGPLSEILTIANLQPAASKVWTKFTRSEMNKCRLIGYCVWWACVFETHYGYGFHIGHFDWNKISFLVIKYYVNTTQNKTSMLSIKTFERQPKWNVMWRDLVFSPVLNLKPTWD